MRTTQRRALGALVLGLAIGAWEATARGEGPAPVVNNPYYAAPGNYGTSWGTASYGTVRTYSEFSSSYGGGYAYGYAPATLLPGPYGVGIWSAGRPAPKYVHGGPNQYRTFAVPYGRPDPSLPPPPPFGVYAPAFGPSFPGW